MRFAELQLVRYGRFENCRLTFPRAERDFHVVFGPNEAGKSTTMAAVSDLLFGFPHSTGFDFRFDAKLLRVGAMLEAGAARLECRRRKGNKNTLIDADERVLDEGPLLSMLHGQTRDVFRLTCSLDHRRLREGGRAIVEAKDDAGQAIFAAGSGLVGVKEVLNALEMEADAVWGRRASEKRTYTRAEREHEAARRELRESQLRPKDWTEARETFDKAHAEQSELEGRRLTTSTALSRAERLRRVYEPIRRRAALLERLAAEAATPLPPLIETAAEEALKLLDDAERRGRAATDLLEQAQSRSEAVVVEDAVLAVGGRIEALQESGAAVRKGLEDLTRREVELTGRRRTIRDLALELKLSAGEDLTGRLPSRLAVAELRGLATQHAAIEVRRSTQQEDRRSEERRLRDLESRLSEATPAEGLDELEIAVQAALRLGDLDATLADRQRALSRAEEALAAAVARLAPWTGSPEALARLAPLSTETIDRARQATDVAVAEAEEARRRELALVEELEALARSIDTMTAAGRTVSAEQVADARTARDAGWNRVRDQLMGIDHCENPRAEASGFEALVQGADALSDLRFASAEDFGRLSHMRERVADLRQQSAHAQRQRATAEAASEHASQGWAERLKAAGLPPLPPSELRTWLELRLLALAAAETATMAADAAQSDAARLDRVRTQLRTVLGQAAAPDAAERLSVVLDGAERRLKSLRDQQTTFSALQQGVGGGRERLAELDRRDEALTRARESWRLEWNRVLADSGLSLAPEGADARLAVYETLRAEVDAATDLERRIAAIKADADGFQGDVERLACQLGEPTEEETVAALLERLRVRLRDARAAGQTRTALQEEVARYAKTVETATAELKAAHESLAEVRGLAGVHDRASVAEAIEASRRRRTLEEEVSALERQIANLGDGEALAELTNACSAGDPDTLRVRAEDLKSQLDALSLQTSEAAERSAVARTRFEQLDSGPKAAQAAADAEQARAEMDAQAELYLLKRAQSLTLRWAMERYRERRQSPLLMRAGALFQSLTLRRYAGLTADLDGDRPRLLGLCDDRATLVEVDAMSEGTQDQLFLALRLAALEHAGARLPFLADDLFVNFDDDRARAGLQVLGELARSTQVLFFTHHAHLVEIAREVFGADAVSACNLEVV